MTRGQKNKRHLLLACCAALTLVFAGGCAYYNTFYNIKQDFRAAEKQTQRAQAGQRAAAPQSGQPMPGGVPVTQYQSILQSCAKLLEYYPNSRWIDDALMIMGICYYRTEEFARAERKFTELTSIFPNSKHVQMALIWRARALMAQEEFDAAESFLTASQSRLTSPNAIAGSARTLATIYDKRAQPEEAVTYLEGIRSISYDRDEKASDYLTLGRSYRALSRKQEARASLEKCLNVTRNPDEAFESRRILAEMSAEEGNYELAIEYLRPLTTDRRFIDRTGNIQVEYAKVEAVAGDPVRAVQILEAFCASAQQGELKARAYMLQGEVARDKLGDLDFAMAKFDSVSSAGAPRALQDSAEYAARQLQIGLSALARIPILADSLDILATLPINAPGEVDRPSEVLPIETSETDSSIEVNDSPETDSIDHDRGMEAANSVVDSTELVEPAVTEEFAEQMSDTLETEVPAQQRDAMSPAQMMADSIMRSLAQQDSNKRAESELLLTANDSVVVEAADSSVVQVSVASGPTPAEVRNAQLASLSNRLVNAHLEAASFYNLVLDIPDSGFVHLERASEVPDSSSEHWRAKVQLGVAMLDRDKNSSLAKRLLETVAYEERASRDLRNAAREVLGLEMLRAEKSPQEYALAAVEEHLLQGKPVDEVIDSYRHVVQMDTHTVSGSRALLAIAYLQEYELGDYSAAMKTHEEIIRLFPDSGYVALSRMKIAEPDSDSVFLLSDEDLAATVQPSYELLTAESDSTGWPPEESTLLGRRFR